MFQLPSVKVVTIIQEMEEICLLSKCGADVEWLKLRCEEDDQTERSEDTVKQTGNFPSFVPKIATLFIRMGEEDQKKPCHWGGTSDRTGHTKDRRATKTMEGASTDSVSRSNYVE